MSNGTDKHPLDADGPDSEWGKQKDAQHKENLARFDRLETRIDEHWKEHAAQHEKIFDGLTKFGERMNASEHDLKTMSDRIDANTGLIGAIKTDTEWILRFTRGARGFKRFLIWATPIASAALTFYVTWTVKK